MNIEKAKILAHELTMLYIKQHNDIMSDTINYIPDMVKNIADINQKFYDEIIHNETLNKLY